MLGSGILDTVIGLIFVFLLVSMLVTIGNELIAGAFSSRAKWLRIGIERLLGSEWAKQLYAHPLIEGTARAPDNSAAGADPASNRGPSYIPSRSFANVLMALLHDSAASVKEIKRHLQSSLDDVSAAGNATLDTLKAWAGPVAGTPPPSPNPGSNDIRTALQAAIDGRPDVAMTQAITKDLAALAGRLKAPYTVADAHAEIQRFIDSMPTRYVRQMIEGLPDERMRKILLALFEDSQNDVEKFKENIEIWFNNSMNRVNGWYKRRSQWFIAGFAVLAAVCMNVDAILIVKHLQTYPGARETLVAQAKAFADRPPLSGAPGAVAGARTVTSGERYKGLLTFAAPAAAAGQVKLASDTAGVALETAAIDVKPGDKQVEFAVDTAFSDKAATATISASGAANGTARLDVRPSLPAQFTAVQAKLADLGLPVGVGWVWDASPSQIRNGQAIPRSFSAGLDTLSQHFLGWFITALAATLGAPFWFDSLNRVISIRSAGKAPEEKPKPPKEVPVPLEPGQSPREADRAAGGRDDAA